MSRTRIATVLLLALAATGCSTGAWFKLPQDTTLIVNERPAEHRQGLVYTRPYSWGASGGIPYKLKNSQSQTVQQGRLKSRFRVPSIFWPPVAIAYWPMGFGQKCYDLTADAPQTCTHQDLIDLRSQHRLRR